MLFDYVLENCTAPGTGTTVSVAGAVAGRKAFSAVTTTGSNVYYVLDDGTQAEWGYGVYTTGTPNTVSRGTVIGNTAGTTSRLNFTGTTLIYNSLPSSRVPWLDANLARTTGFIANGADAGGLHYRAVGGTYGAGIRNDGASCYLLSTNSGSQYTTYNTLRPFSWNLSTGAVNIDFGGAGTALGGALTVNGNVKAGNTAGGYVEKTGYSGAFGISVFNFYWTGAALQAWIDTTNVGSVTLTSDDRFKHSVATMADGALDRILALRPITYRWRDGAPFVDDGKAHEGLIAQEVRAVIPAAVHDGETLSLDTYALIGVLTKAVQELTARVHVLEEKVSAHG
jgi:Chaperone of endosialidase